MDWSTVLASAGISALVGTLVSLVAVSQVTTRTARAERREAARVKLAEVVEPLIRELARYMFSAGAQKKGRRDPGEGDPVAHLGDLNHVTAVLGAADGLSTLRAKLVERRCRRVFGSYWVDLRIAYPTSNSLSDQSFSTWLASSISESKLSGDPREGLMHRAYREPPGTRAQNDLRRELRKLRKSR